MQLHNEWPSSHFIIDQRNENRITRAKRSEETANSLRPANRTEVETMKKHFSLLEYFLCTMTLQEKMKRLKLRSLPIHLTEVEILKKYLSLLEYFFCTMSLQKTELTPLPIHMSSAPDQVTLDDKSLSGEIKQAVSKGHEDSSKRLWHASDLQSDWQVTQRL